MKLISLFIFLLFVPELGMAQELVLSSKENTPSNMNGQAAVPQSPIYRSPQHLANSAPANNSPIELKALYDGAGFMPEPDLISNITQTDGSGRGIIEEWRERMFKTISQYLGPHQQDPAQGNRLLTNDELYTQADEGRIVMKLVLKETLKFSKERVVEIDRLVKALKYEVSSDNSGSANAGEEASGSKTGDSKIPEKRSGKARPAGNAVVNDKIIIKTGLRVRIDSGKLGLVSETEARYGKASYFYRVNLDNQGDNSLGFRYVLGKDIFIQVERAFNRTMDPTAKDKPSTNLLQLGCRF